MILRGKALKDLRAIKDMLVAAGDPFLASVMNRAIGCIENQPSAPALIMEPVRAPAYPTHKECATCTNNEDHKPCTAPPGTRCYNCPEPCACWLCTDYDNWEWRGGDGG